MVRAADLGRLLMVTGDVTRAFIELGDDVFRRADFEERHPVFATGGEDALARLLHLHGYASRGTVT